MPVLTEEIKIGERYGVFLNDHSGTAVCEVTGRIRGFIWLCVKAGEFFGSKGPIKVGTRFVVHYSGAEFNRLKQLGR